MAADWWNILKLVCDFKKHQFKSNLQHLLFPVSDVNTSCSFTDDQINSLGFQ